MDYNNSISKTFCEHVMSKLNIQIRPNTEIYKNVIYQTPDNILIYNDNVLKSDVLLLDTLIQIVKDLDNKRDVIISEEKIINDTPNFIKDPDQPFEEDAFKILLEFSTQAPVLLIL